jgi:lipid-A-disaccharide synthase
MKYYIIAGEASGDLHGSNLIKELKKLDASGDFRVWGGDKMQAAGAALVKHYKDLAFMGFTEVLKNISAILKNIQLCKQDILQYRPDALILIDYPGFNLRIAKWARQKNLKIIYYISPQLWAWNESRVKLIRQCVDKMLVILPFEKDFYKKHGYEVEYVGHPLVEVIENYKAQNKSTMQHATKERGEVKNIEHQTINIIALLPGSRKQELELKLPIMLGVAKHFPGYQFIVAKAPGIEDRFYERFLSPYKNVSAVSDQTYSLLAKASAALVTSGTATLETALFGVPEIVCYKGNELSYQIAKRLVKIKFISLVNLIMNKEVVKELIQKDLTVKNLTKELTTILTNHDRQQQIANDYAELKNLLDLGGKASSNAARSVYEFVT